MQHTTTLTDNSMPAASWARTRKHYRKVEGEMPFEMDEFDATIVAPIVESARPIGVIRGNEVRDIGKSQIEDRRHTGANAIARYPFSIAGEILLIYRRHLVFVSEDNVALRLFHQDQRLASIAVARHIHRAIRQFANYRQSRELVAFGFLQYLVRVEAIV